MGPIYIFAGSERYLLSRAGTQSSRTAEPLAPAHARAILEAALRRREPALIQALSAILHMRGDDPEAIVTRALARLATTGSIGGDLVLMRAHQAEVQRVRVERPEPPVPESAPEPVEQEQQEEEAPPQARTTIRVSLFFDGTANNRANTRERLRAEAEGKKFKKSGSYDNDESNVSRLETLYVGDSTFEHSLSIYVEGIGTEDGKSDSTYGMALGLGATGVVGKVKRGVDELLRGIRELGIASGVIIERFHIDTFGFSRGAAAARHCVHYCLNGENPLQPRIEGLGYPVESLEVNFVGLFDTVASYGVVHSNDTRDLDLDAIRVAKKVVQLAASEEHRKNFRLTDIRSAIGAGVGIELYLPGVHSDVGGGYTDFSEELELPILDFVQSSNNEFDPRLNDELERRLAREREWLIDSGWYRPDEITKVWNALVVTRRGIRNHYNRIPLAHMARFAAQTGLTFDPTTERFPIPSALAGIDALVADHVAAHIAGTAPSTAQHWIDMRTPDYRRLRHDYLHFSAYFRSIPNPPQFSSGGAMHGRRERIVQAG